MGRLWCAAGLVILLSGCSVARQADRAMLRRAERAGLLPQELHQTDGDFDVHYLVSTDPVSSARPLLVVHGFGGDGPSNWLPQIEALASDRPLIVPDLLWFGRSVGDTEPTLRAQVEAMVAVLDQEGVEQVDVMGISYGGFVALGLLEVAPERVGRLVLVDSPGPQFTPADEAAMYARHGVSSAAELFVPDSADGVKALFEAVMVKPPPMPRFVARSVHAQYFSQHVEAQRALLADLPRQRMMLDHLDSERAVPHLVVWGSEDPIFPLASGEALAESLGARLVVIDGVGHAPNIEAPRAFNRAVGDYLADPAPEALRVVVTP